jgi:hypothetical protein
LAGTRWRLPIAFRRTVRAARSGSSCRSWSMRTTLPAGLRSSGDSSIAAQPSSRPLQRPRVDRRRGREWQLEPDAGAQPQPDRQLLRPGRRRRALSARLWQRRRAAPARRTLKCVGVFYKPLLKRGSLLRLSVLRRSKRGLCKLQRSRMGWSRRKVSTDSAGTLTCLPLVSTCAPAPAPPPAIAPITAPLPPTVVPATSCARLWCSHHC